jgi:hypothetical protein
MRYQLTITIDNAGLTALYAADLAIAIVKGVLGEPRPVVWQQFQPFEENAVSWSDDYGLFATATPLQPGAVILPNATTEDAAQMGWTYSFAQGQFTGAPGGPAEGYNALNQAGRTLGFGLMQRAGVNNVPVFAPVGATPLANEMVGVFTPVEAVLVFVAPLSRPGLVLAEIPATALPVALTPARPVAALGYDDATQTFQVIGETAPETFRSPRAIAGRLASKRS